MKKYRAGKIKREHSVIEKLWPTLERMAECEHITSIIPGPISPLNTRGFAITFQRLTETGLRLLAKNGSAVQEIWAVAADKDAALRWLADRGIVNWEPERPQAPARECMNVPEPRKTVVLPSDMPCEHCGRPMLAGSRAVQLGRKRYSYMHTRCAT